MIGAVKNFTEGGIYHVYNRGVNKEDIFFADEDFYIFIELLDRYLCEKDPLGCTKNYKGRISLFAFCLLRNHIHLFLRQTDERAITEFMQSLSVSFTMRINNKYKRVGHLFQGVYKARSVLTDAEFANVFRYVHLNAGETEEERSVYPHSSAGMYLNENKGLENGVDVFPFIDTAATFEFISRDVCRNLLRDSPGRLGQASGGALGGLSPGRAEPGPDILPGSGGGTGGGTGDGFSPARAEPGLGSTLSRPSPVV